MHKANADKLYLITKLQNLKAIHNLHHFLKVKLKVVSNYKITKSESYSQLFNRLCVFNWCCI